MAVTEGGSPTGGSPVGDGGSPTGGVPVPGNGSAGGEAVAGSAIGRFLIVSQTPNRQVEMFQNLHSRESAAIHKGGLIRLTRYEQQILRSTEFIYNDGQDQSLLVRIASSGIYILQRKHFSAAELGNLKAPGCANQ